MAESKKTDEGKIPVTDDRKIEKIDATADEIARAIFAAADMPDEDKSEEEKDQE